MIWTSTELTDIRDMGPSVPIQYHNGFGFLGTFGVPTLAGLVSTPEIIQRELPASCQIGRQVISTEIELECELPFTWPRYYSQLSDASQKKNSV